MSWAGLEIFVSLPASLLRTWQNAARVALSRVVSCRDRGGPRRDAAWEGQDYCHTGLARAASGQSAAFSAC